MTSTEDVSVGQRDERWLSADDAFEQFLLALQASTKRRIALPIELDHAREAWARSMVRDYEKENERCLNIIRARQDESAVTAARRKRAMEIARAHKSVKTKRSAPALISPERQLQIALAVAGRA